MATVGSVSSNITTKTGIGGLASGMDIDSLVLKMTAASRAKITKQEQSLQTLEWKQSAYRSVTKALTEFRDKYLNSLSATNFKSGTLYNTVKATVGEKVTAFTATAQTGVGAGKAYVNKIEQLATSETITSASVASKPLEAELGIEKLMELWPNASSSSNGKDFMLTLDGVSRTVSLDNEFWGDLYYTVWTDLAKTGAYNLNPADPADPTDPTDPNFNWSNIDSNALDWAVIGKLNNTNGDVSKGEMAGYLRKALQVSVNRVFENPPETTPPGATPTYKDYLAIGDPKITVSVNGNGLKFEARDGSRLSIGYATQPSGVNYVRGDNENIDVYTARVKAEEEAAHKNTGLGMLGFEDKQSNRIDIYSSIADLQGKINGNFVPAGLDKDGNQYVYTDTRGVHELTNTNFNFSINDVKFSIDPNESLYSVMNKINSSTAGVTLSYSEVTDKFTLTSKTAGTGENFVLGDLNRNLLSALGLQNSSYDVGIKDKDTGVVSDLPNDIANNNAIKAHGQNAIAYIDGQKIERSSNEFTVNGIAYVLKETYRNEGTDEWHPYDPLNDTPADSATKGEMITLAPDATKLVETVKNFVSDYNALVDLLYGLTNEEVFSDYEPLTEEQRASMSESQVKLWEEKAKSGLLRSDSTVNKIFNSMREAFFSSVDGFSLFNMGITYGTVTDSWKSNGKLTISDEAKLKSTLESKPDQVREFFTNASKGAITKLDKAIDDAVRTSGGQGHRGSLIEMAGMPSTMSEQENSIYTQMVNHTKRINTLKDLLEKEESRLWARFTAMEEALSKINEQSSILSQYLGTGNS